MACTSRRTELVPGDLALAEALLQALFRKDDDQPVDQFEHSVERNVGKHLQLIL